MPRQKPLAIFAQLVRGDSVHQKLRIRVVGLVVSDLVGRHFRAGEHVDADLCALLFEFEQVAQPAVGDAAKKSLPRRRDIAVQVVAVEVVRADDPVVAGVGIDLCDVRGALLAAIAVARGMQMHFQFISVHFNSFSRIFYHRGGALSTAWCISFLTNVLWDFIILCIGGL